MSWWCYSTKAHAHTHACHIKICMCVFCAWAQIDVSQHAERPNSATTALLKIYIYICVAFGRVFLTGWKFNCVEYDIARPFDRKTIRFYLENTLLIELYLPLPHIPYIRWLTIAPRIASCTAINFIRRDFCNSIQKNKLVGVNGALLLFCKLWLLRITIDYCWSNVLLNLFI